MSKNSIEGGAKYRGVQYYSASHSEGITVTLRAGSNEKGSQMTGWVRKKEIPENDLFLHCNPSSNKTWEQEIETSMEKFRMGKVLLKKKRKRSSIV